MRSFTRAALALALCGSALSAFAADGFTGSISFGQSDYAVDTMVTMSLSGVGVCKNFTVDWGDGTPKTTVMSYDFGMDGPFKHQHTYHTPGVYGTTISEIKGPNTHEQCGARSSSIHITETVKITGVVASATTVKPGDDVIITVNGTGKCEGKMAVVYNTQPLGAQIFEPNAAWPRVAIFKNLPAASADYYFSVYHVVNGSPGGTDGACWSSAHATVSVKAAPQLNLVPVVATPTRIGPIGAVTPPAKPAQPTGGTPATPCKVLGKTGVGKDCN